MAWSNKTKRSAKEKSSGQLTRELMQRLGYRTIKVEVGFGGPKKDFLDFIDDLAFQDAHMIAIQSCFHDAVSSHLKKFNSLIEQNHVLVEWLKIVETWLVSWRKVNDVWMHSIQVLNPSLSKIKLPEN